MTIGLLATATDTLAVCDFDDFPVMDEMRVQVIMDSANYNNRPMMVRSYYVDTGIDKVIDYYHRQWKDLYDDTSFGIWEQISTLNDDCMMTVQVATEGDSSSHGRLIISNVPTGNPEAELGEGVVAPGDGVVVSDLTSKDGGKLGRVTMITSSQSTSEVMAFYGSEMVNKGWALEKTFEDGGHAVMVFRNGLDTTNVLVVPAGDMTQILVNKVTID